MNKRVILLTSMTGDALERVRASFGIGVETLIADDLDALRHITITPNTTLVSFGSGVIVPADVLSRLSKPAYNLHAAPPAFPGRDPHHHAIYQQASEYGATLHIMTDRVDAGPIVDVVTFPITTSATPSEILARANEIGVEMLERLGQQLLSVEPLAPLANVSWGGNKTKRKDMLQLCTMTPLVDEREFARRRHAFSAPGYDNISVELHGYRFRIDKTPFNSGVTDKFDEFTERGFRMLLTALKAGGYRFAAYGEAESDRHVIWRHDVDFSMHRAHRLAQIEQEEGAVATYFVNPRSNFYSLLEPEVERLLGGIRAAGHEIGLHFDAGAYGETNWTASALTKAIQRERGILEMILGTPIRVASWHNPDMSNLLTFEDDEIAGLINAYGASLKTNYTYCSDSNGYWRYQPMQNVIAAGHQRLHLLTHPAWWTVEPMSPSSRVDRALLGRARAARKDYDALLARGNRNNLTDAD